MNYEIDLFKKKYIKYKLKYITSKQKGGEDTEQLLKKMRDHKGEFVLVIGSNKNEPHCLEFSKSPENLDKMVVSIDGIYDSDNNFKHGTISDIKLDNINEKNIVEQGIFNWDFVSKYFINFINSMLVPNQFFQ